MIVVADPATIDRRTPGTMFVTMTISDIYDDDSGFKHEDGSIDWGKVEEEFGRDAVEGELDPYAPDANLEAYLNETDTSCTNEDLGRDPDGNRDDD